MIFNKYEGAGNDFIIIDNLGGKFIADEGTIARLCNRRFGVGADGLILICREPGVPYRMKYFNSDGHEGSMCGNGGRCAAHFAYRHQLAGRYHHFMACDGLHHAAVNGEMVTVSLSDVKIARKAGKDWFINTGSPHLVVFCENPDQVDIVSRGRELRYSDRFEPAGTNVNFVSVSHDGLYVRTYERGVEDETLSCGTGATASAIASVLAGHFVSPPVTIRTRGGTLVASFEITAGKATSVTLTGPATFVYSGEIEI